MITRALTVRVAAGIACAALVLSAAIGPSLSLGDRNADEQKALNEDTTEFGEAFVLSLGGKLYDNVWATTGVEHPGGKHPAYPAEGKARPEDTWRCPACHGWDYLGRDGHLGNLLSGQHAGSLRHLAGEDPIVIVEKLVAAPHVLPQSDLPNLTMEIIALFISLGQYEHTSFFDAAGSAKGDPARGRSIYEGACMNCHRPDGRALLTGEAGDRSSLGWLARNRKEQVLHKVINGVPGAEMLSMRFLGASQLADLMAFLQRLDPKER